MNSTAASRLCAACGLCCNGVMFQKVRLQPGDNPQELIKAGLKLKRRHTEDFFAQPCTAFRETHCAIYTQRPTRCRLFECQQLKRVASGEITEATALAKIQDAKSRVTHLEGLLQQDGTTNTSKPLLKRCEQAVAEPLDASTDPAKTELLSQIAISMKELDTLLDQDFRITPTDVEAL